VTAARALVFAAAAAAAGCSGLNAPVYFNGPEALEVSGMGTTLMPSLDRRGIALRFRNPTQAEQAALDTQAQELGFDVPWVARDKVHIELSFTVTNVDTAAGMFNVMIDGADEFTQYDLRLVAALFTAQNQPPVYLPLIQSRPQILQPGQSYTGTMREDDFAEAELDVDDMGRWMAPFAFVLINRSDVTPLPATVVIPPMVVVPALTEIDVYLVADKHMTCTYLVRVRDDDDRLLHQSTDTLFAPQPALYQPMLPPRN
jgi:hypothetical protein